MSEKRTNARDRVLCGLVDLLPESGTWTVQQRDTWLRMVRLVIDWCIPVVSSAMVLDEVEERAEMEGHGRT